jgi:homoserine O-succinyltransferase
VLGRRGIAPSEFATSDVIEIALVNNMPDSALESTERQFTNLLAAAAGDLPVRVRLFSLPEVPRGAQARRHLTETASSLADLFGHRTDGLIVTGTEPRTTSLKDEPYWAAMSRLVDWAEDNTIASIWSCLAAHVAVQHTDGIRRAALPQKCSGVFACANTFEDPLFAGLPQRFSVPHSRRNDLIEDELVAHGYAVLSRSAKAGVDSFVKRMRSTFLFFQGHPEYEADTLYREYRRDVSRYLREDRDDYPAMPEGYFGADAADRLVSFRARALAGRNESLLADFPAAPPDLSAFWRPAAICIYRNWLTLIAAERAKRSRPATHASRAPALALALAPRESLNLIALKGNAVPSSGLRTSLRLAAQPPSVGRSREAPVTGQKPRA